MTILWAALAVLVLSAAVPGLLYAGVLRAWWDAAMEQKRERRYRREADNIRKREKLARALGYSTIEAMLIDISREEADRAAGIKPARSWRL